MLNVFDYTDYRKFLGDYYSFKKKSNKAFSYRYIARRVGFRSPGFFGQIVRAESNISLETARKLASFLQLKNAETAYFEELVLFNQSSTHKQKKASFEKLITHKKAKIYKISADQYRLFEKWYYYPIKCIIDIVPFNGDYKGLAHMLIPSLSAEQARGAIRVLEELEMIYRDEHGAYRAKPRHIIMHDGAKDLAINNYSLNMIDLSKKAIDHFDSELRLISATTFNASSMAFSLIRDEIRTFRSKIRAIVDADAADAQSRIYQLNFQFFPLSDPLDKKEPDA
jgi:uncharacterized protein (TIGR02147 family)